MKRLSHFAVKNEGFTLVELIIVICVFSILVALAMPAWQNFVLNERLNSTQGNIINAINLAKGMAVTDDTTATMCPYSAASSTTCGSSWASGVIVVEQSVASGSVLLKAIPATSGMPVLSTLTAGISSITFNPRPPFVTNFTDFKLCDSRGASYAMAFSLQSTGYVQTAPTIGYAMNGSSSLTCP